jgi:hypothetical protein
MKAHGPEGESMIDRARKALIKVTLEQFLDREAFALIGESDDVKALAVERAVKGLGAALVDEGASPEVIEAMCAAYGQIIAERAEELEATSRLH